LCLPLNNALMFCLQKSCSEKFVSLKLRILGNHQGYLLNYYERARGCYGTRYCQVV